MRPKKIIPTAKIVRLYREHQSSRIVGEMLGCNQMLILNRLKEVGEPRRKAGGSKKGCINYAQDKLARAIELGYSGWDEVIYALHKDGKNTREIADFLGGVTSTNVGQRIKYLKGLNNDKTSI